MPTIERKNVAHVAPFMAFMVIALIFQFVGEFGFKLDNAAQPWFRRRPEYLMMLLQMLVCFPMLIYWRKVYEWNFNKGWVIGVSAGLVGIALWILPTHIYSHFELGSDNVEDPAWYTYLGLADRSEGFDASILEDSPFWYPAAIFLRFLRAVILVSLIEEIFWRGFLMRFIKKYDGNYWSVKFGEHHWLSYLVVTACFMLVHQPVDYSAAFLFGSLMYLVAIYTKSLFACVLMHAVANLVLGYYAFTYSKFGLW
ncbi:CAAX prenyl protease-related protein [Akkermansiaceae bacterium]|nr:CAAX prenyl protease-related protein [Akkermansiaceae bacterium]